MKKIKEIAEDVYKVIGSGYSEEVYDKAMQVGLTSAGILFESQKVVEIIYKNQYVGYVFPDLVVDIEGEKNVVELKSLSQLGTNEYKQLINYVTLMGLKRGLLINFKKPDVNEKTPTVGYMEYDVGGLR